MTEADRTPMIRLEIDQQVFIDVVRAGDNVEDATVATEVTSFERVGDAYVLEGAIVFAGYVQRRDDARGQPEAEDDLWPYGLDEEHPVQHFHHRMPFWLRVPAKSQPRGLVNVASRLTDWKLEVVDDAWLRITADLSISGLNHRDGYHFQCGAQEEGDLFFHSTDAIALADAGTADQTQAADAPQWEIPVSADTDVLPAQAALHTHDVPAGRDEAFAGMLRGRDSAGPEPDDEIEAISASRGGLSPEAGAVDAADVPPPAARDAPAPSDGAEFNGQVGEGDADSEIARHKPVADPRQDLAGFDRVFTGHTASAPESIDASADAGAGDVRSEQAHPAAKGHGWAEFEFEHQINADEAAQPAPEQPPAKEYGTEFIPSRSFAGDGFRPAAGFVQSQKPAPPDVSVGAPAPHDASEGWEPTTDRSEEGVDPSPEGVGVVSVNRSLWSFVDFNAPERRYTLRFVVVMEEETLDSVAERVGCSKAELVRANRLVKDLVRPGQTLLIPYSSAPEVR